MKIEIKVEMSPERERNTKVQKSQKRFKKNKHFNGRRI